MIYVMGILLQTKSRRENYWDFCYRNGSKLTVRDRGWEGGVNTKYDTSLKDINTVHATCIT